MKRVAGALLLAGLLQAPVVAGEAATVQASVSIQPGGMSVAADPTPLRFADARVGEPALVPGISAPTLTLVDARGEAGAGWHVTLSAGDLVSSEGHRIAASRLTFDPRGGRLQRLSGSAVDPEGGPRETGLAGDLARGVRAVTAAPGRGRGSYVYIPDPGAFALDVPADAYAGDYRGTVLVNIVSGP